MLQNQPNNNKREHTFASSVRRWSGSSSIRSEGEQPFILVEKLIGDEVPAKPVIDR